MLRIVALILTIMTGVSGLVYEVCWQKCLATLLGSHSEATASVLGIFLAGLSLGYALFGRITNKIVERAEREACRMRKGLCLPLLVEWTHLDAKSESLKAAVESYYQHARTRMGGPIHSTEFNQLIRITSPSTSRQSVDIERAIQATRFFRWFFRYPAPFDPDPLVALWERCLGPKSECEKV